MASVNSGSLTAQGIKATGMDKKWIPVICGVLGGTLGVAGIEQSWYQLQ